MSATALVPTLLALALLGLLVSRPGGRRSRASTQANHLAIDAIADDVVAFADGRRCAVLEVGSVNFATLSAGKRRELVTGYGAILAGLTYPVQVLVRAVPLDLSPYLDEREERARREPHERLRHLNRDRNAFVRRLAGTRTLLDRRFYLIIPADPPPPAARLRRPRARGAGRDVTGAAEEAVAAVRQLAARCDDLAGQLGRCGLAARRLGDGELAELHYACWCPDLARRQRLRRDLHDSLGLVVGTRPPDDTADPVERRVS